MTSFLNISRNFDFSNVQDNVKKRLQSSTQNDGVLNNVNCVAQNGLSQEISYASFDESVLYDSSYDEPVLLNSGSQEYIEETIDQSQPQYVDTLEEIEEPVLDSAATNPNDINDLKIGTEIKYNSEIFADNNLHNMLGTFGILQSARSVINYD